MAAMQENRPGLICNCNYILCQDLPCRERPGAVFLGCPLVLRIYTLLNKELGQGLS